MNPIDEALEFKKTSAPNVHHTQAIGRQLSKSLGTERLTDLAAATAMTVGGSAALMAIVPAAQKIHTAVTKNRDFNKMMGVNPHLAELREENPEMFSQAYDSLRNINPTFGKDPLIAGSYMNKMMLNPEQAGATLAQTIKPPLGPQPFDPIGKQPFKVSPAGEYEEPSAPSASDILSNARAEDALELEYPGAR